jgi:hypothetical protein
MKPPGQAQAPARSNASFAVFRESRPPVMVVSHERSGTHFLMNSIARGYGYTAEPWIDMDYPRMPINYFHPSTLAGALESLADQRIASIVKTHHAAEFFDGVLNRILKRYIVFYIHRDPVEVMLSFWRFMHRWQWHEGPKRADPIAFATAEPEGQLMRYQTHQRRNMLDRWAKHVEGWHKASLGRPRLRLVPYASLRDDYEATLSSFADLLGRKPQDLTPPAKDENVIPGGTVAHKPDVAALRALAAAEVGETMRLLGYS